MSGPTLAEVIREHSGVDYVEWRNMYVCTCNADLPLDGPRVPHSDHVAAAVLAWIEGRLADGDVREVVESAIDDTYRWRGMGCRSEWGTDSATAADAALAAVRGVLGEGVAR